MKRSLLILIIFCSISYYGNAEDIKFKDSGIVLRLAQYYGYYLAHTVTDWNNDGTLDIISGFITDPIVMVFAQNIGTTASPQFKTPPVNIAIPSS